MLRALRVHALTTAVLLGLAAAPAARADEDWVLLGTREVAFRAERDVIQSSVREGRFDAIKLQVLSNDIEVQDLTVHFGNGEKQDVSVRESIAAGQHTRVIELAGDPARVIDRVALVYRTKGRGEKATVRVLARRAGTGAPQVQWVRLGRREVDFKAERDSIEVTGEAGRFRRICLEVEGNGVEVLDLDVRFGDGQKQDIAVREQIAAGGRTRAIDLDGGARVIQRVNLAYRTRGAREGKATVHLLGERAADDAPAAAPRTPPAAPAGGNDADDRGWELLGQREVDFKAERDSIAVGRGEGRFTKLRVRALGNDIEMLDLKVTFGNGDTQDIQVREVIAQGHATRVIDLPGAARAIRSIDFTYRTRGANREGKATVKGFGKND